MVYTVSKILELLDCVIATIILFVFNNYSSEMDSNSDSMPIMVVGRSVRSRPH